MGQMAEGTPLRGNVHHAVVTWGWGGNGELGDWPNSYSKGAAGIVFETCK